jgi:hypothetical protein
VGIARRSARAALVALAAATATLAVAGLTTLAPASAATRPASGTQDVTVTLTPSSGSNYSSDKATLSWTDQSACVGQEIDAFMYAGSGPWNANAINTAEGNNGAQTTYWNFSTSAKPTSTTGSTSWPNVANGGYTDFGERTTPLYTTTADLVAALGGAGIYTIGLACVNGTTFTPILDSSGNPIAGTLTLDIGVTGNSWKVLVATPTTVALTGSGTSGALGNKVSLSAHVTASDGTVPAGGVNFYANATGTGTPLNGSTPVPVGSNGDAAFSGSSGYTVKGAQAYSAQFVPTNAALYDPSPVQKASIDLIAENLTITVTATQDPGSPNAVDLKAAATGSPTPLGTALPPNSGVAFIADGSEILAPGGHSGFLFNKSFVATTTISHLKFGQHVFSAEPTAGAGILNPAVGYAVTVNTVKQALTGYATATAVSVAETSTALEVTAKVTGKTASGQKVTLVASGRVTVKDGSVTLGTATLSGKSGSGVATATVTGYSLPAGANVFTVAFTPANTNFLSSTGKTTLTVKTAVKWVHPGKPSIKGTAKVGSTLTAEPGAWSPSGLHFAYQWYANGTKIKGATHATLKLASAQRGKAITVDVTGSRTGYRTESATSSPTAKVAG